MSPLNDFLRNTVCKGLTEAIGAGPSTAAVRGLHFGQLAGADSSAWRRAVTALDTLTEHILGPARAAIGRVFTTRDFDMLLARNSYLRSSHPAVYDVWKNFGYDGINSLHTASHRSASVAAEAGLLATRARRLGLSNPLNSGMIAKATAFTPVAELERAANMPKKTPADIHARAAVMRRTLYSHLDAGFAESTKTNFLSLGIRDFGAETAAIRTWAESLSDSQSDTIADALGHQLNLQRLDRVKKIKLFRDSHPAEAALSEEAVASKLGLGPLLPAWYAHVFENEWRGGFIDDLTTAAVGSGALDIGGPTNPQRTTLGQIVRAVVNASPQTPLNHGGKVFDNPQTAFAAIFPKLEPVTYLPKLRIAARSADDAGLFAAVVPEIKNPFLLERQGVQGFTADFWLQYEAVTRAAARDLHIGPIMAPGGALYKLINELYAVDRPSAIGTSDAIKRIAGIAPRQDAAFRDLQQITHGVSGLIYKSLVRLNPGIALPNILSIPMLLFPEAFRAGWKTGALDLKVGFALTRSREFTAMLEHAGLLNTYTYVRSLENPGAMFARLQVAIDTADPKAGAAVMREWMGAGSDFLSLTEILVKRSAAGVGAARYLREQGLHDLPWASLTDAHKDGLFNAMHSVMAKTTIIPGASNTVPLQRLIQAIPAIGPVSSMFTATPAMIASNFYTEIKTLLNPYVEREIWGEAFRSFSAKMFFGTLVAGPFWIYPALREMESDEDAEGLIGLANAWEKWGSVAGLLNTDLARRLNPVSGITERLAPFGSQSAGESITRVALGPLGSPAYDIFAALFGIDEGARRRALGGFAPWFDGTPPSSALPGLAQSLLPIGGIGVERMLRIAMIHSGARDPRGYVTYGPLGIPVANPAGFRLDARGRAFQAEEGLLGSVRHYIWGSRDLEVTRGSGRAKGAEKRADHRAQVETQIRSAILDGDTTRALQVFAANRGLDPVITVSELERESLMRKLPPEARAVYVGNEGDSLNRAMKAADALAQGGLSEKEALVERSIVLAAVLKFRRPHYPPRDALLSAATPPIAQ